MLPKPGLELFRRRLRDHGSAIDPSRAPASGKRIGWLVGKICSIVGRHYRRYRFKTGPVQNPLPGIRDLVDENLPIREVVSVKEPFRCGHKGTGKGSAVDNNLSRHQSPQDFEQLRISAAVSRRLVVDVDQRPHAGKAEKPLSLCGRQVHAAMAHRITEIGVPVSTV